MAFYSALIIGKIKNNEGTWKKYVFIELLE